jgi:hypothetical protein
MPQFNKKPKAPDKPAITVLALKRPERPATIENPVKDEVISLPTTEETVSDDAASPHPRAEKPSIEVANITEPKPKKIITIDLVSKSPSPQNDDPLIGTEIEVTAPWGDKTLVTVIDTYVAPSGNKWLTFAPISECPPGWTWEGGVKLISQLPPT